MSQRSGGRVKMKGTRGMAGTAGHKSPAKSSTQPTSSTPLPHSLAQGNSTSIIAIALLRLVCGNLQQSIKTGRGEAWDVPTESRHLQLTKTALLHAKVL